MSDIKSHSEIKLAELFSQQMEIMREQIELLKRQSREEPAPAPTPAAVAPGKTRIAVIGMAGRFPGARNVAEFWQNLNAGVESITTFRPDEIDPAVPFEERSHPNYGRSRGVLEDADKFDAEFFRINPREAKLIDPQQRVFLEVAYEALQDAGYDPDRFPGEIGVYGGIGDNYYHIHNVLDKKDLIQKVGSLAANVGNMKDYVATRVSYKLNLRGPSISLNTACSTSLVAVDQAVLGLRNHTCDIALAGASSIYVPQKAGFMHGPGLPFASDGHIRPFSSDATGVMFSDGAGIVVLKRLDDAIRDRDHIYGVIIGSAINNDGLDKMSFFAPSAEGQTKVITKALKDANVSAETLSFIEAHATGTLLGDPVEFEGLKAAFAPFTQKKGFCALGAFKGNIGHTDAAAGVTGLIKALLALKHKKLPPNINFKNANPAIDLEHSPFYIPTAPVPLTAGAQPIRAGISAFGFGGTNAHVIIEEAPAVKVQESRKPAHILLVSGETSGALERNAKALAEHLNAHPSLSLPALEYTLAAGRKSFAQRRFLVASSLEEARETLNRNELSATQTSQKGRALAFMFPGQGTQSLNMGKALYENEAVFRKAFDSCAEILQPMLGLDLRTLVYPSQELEAAAEQQLAQTCYAQPALFTIQYALAQYFLNLGLKPQAMVGHSLGEFTCATLSGVLDLKDALFLVAQRGKLMQSMAPGSMLSVNLSEADARLLLDATIDIAAINGPRQCVLAGSSEKLSALKVELEGKGKGIGCRPLKTSHAFHSPTVDAIQSEFIRILNGIPLKAPRTPYVSTLTATWITAEQAQSPGYWAQHMRQAVRFYDSIRTLWATQPYLLLELGPRDTATVLARKASSDPARFKAIPTLTGDDSYRSVLHAIGQLWSEGASLDWDHYFAGQSRQRVPLPTYSFEKVSHWLDTIPADGKPATPTQYEETKEEPQQLVIAPAPVTTAEKGLKERIRAIFIEASGMSMSSSHDDLGFLELGLDSLTLTQVSASLKREFRVDLPQGLLLKQENTLNRLTTWLEARVGIAANSDSPSIIHVPQSTKSLASFSQRRMWMHAQVNPEATTYNIPIYFSIQGALDARILAESLDLVISRHDVLRSSYHLEEDRIYQKVSPSSHAELDRIDLSHLPKSVADAELHKRLHQLGRTPFRLDQGTLIRFHLFKINAEDHVFLLNAHHIVFDLISIQRFLTEVGQAYKNLSLGLAVDRSKPRVQYADFVAWQKTWAESGAMDQQIAFWQKHLGASALPILKLPTDHPRPKMQPEVDHFVTLTLPKEPLRPLWELAAKAGATPFMLMLAAYQYLLMLLSGQRDLVVGTTIASRTHPDTQDMIGFFANTLALRSSVSEHTGFLDFLAQIKDTVLAAFDHQDAPLDEVMRKLELRRDPSVNPLFQTFFSFEKVNKETYDMGSIRMKFMGDVSRAAPATDLNIWVEEHPEELRIVAEYSTDLFQAETVAGFMQVFDTLMKKLAANPLAKLEDLKSLFAPVPMPVIAPPPAMDEAESTFKNLIQDILGLTHVDMSKSFPYQGGHSLLAIRLIEKIKQTYDVDVELKDILKAPALQQILDAIQLSQAASLPVEKPEIQGSIHQLVSASCQEHPERIALRYRNKTMTRAELDRRSNRVARYLQKNGVRPGDIVGISMDRSMELIVGMLGILKSGAAYLPMDPAYPNDRLSYMAENSGLNLILTEEEYADTLIMPAGVRMIAMDEEAAAIMACSDAALNLELPRQSLAYVIYTSGSTGKPKGVQIPHSSAVNFLHGMRKAIGFESDDVLMALTTICFDISVLEIFLTLATGATLILMDSESALDGKKLAQTIEDYGVTFFQATPSGWRILTESGWKGSENLTGLCGGEAFPRDLAEKLIPRLKAVYNVYGPTEATVWATYHKVTSPEDHKLIGRPLENYSIHILDEKLQPVPAGEIGDLYIGGQSLAVGYMNRPDLTSERFLPSPFARGERIYNTGDRARFVQNGVIEYISRADDQVKIRGYRIELGEIEAVANSYEAVKLSAAVVHEFSPGDQRIVLFVNTRPALPFSENELKDFMRKSLPDYFLPNMVRVIDAIPLTHNGKIDRKVLKASCAATAEQERPKKKAGSTEDFLRELWKNRLKVNDFSSDSTFFDLGGYSLLAIILAKEISDATGKSISLADLLTSTFEQLVYRLDHASHDQMPAAEPPLERRSSRQ